MERIFDLFGDEIAPPQHGSGRPWHHPTLENRRLVKALADDGKRQPAIAARLGISLPTLRLHYFDELGSRSQAHRRLSGRECPGHDL